MARMHARRRGRASSHRPNVTVQPEWVPLSREEIESKVIALAKEGHTPSVIGLILRDRYGVPSFELAVGKKLTRFLAEKGMGPPIPEDLMALMRRAVRISRGLHKKDRHGKYRLSLIEAKIYRLERYYKSRGILPADWKYSVETASRIVLQ